MIPQTLVKMESMPLNTSGKIDRHSLPEPEQQTSTGEVGEPLETEKEKMIAQAWQKVLNVPVLSKSDNFFSLGGHSLKAIAAVAALSKNFDITVNQIFENQTVKELALATKRIQDNLKIKLSNLKDRVEQAVNAPPVDPKDEPELKPLWKNYDRRIAEILESDLSSPAPYEHVLLTGATGYLGIFLLKDLLENTDGKVTCIVRAESNEAAVGRIDEKSFYYFDQSLSQRFPKRLQILSGDLSADMLGLSTDAYQNLSSTTEAILHSAANVRHYGHYEEFEKANVQSTRNLIKMAEDGNKADMHLVSTMSVGNGEVDGLYKTLFTEFDGDISQKLNNYYLKTKLESEELVVQARTRGLKGNIYRIGNITFDTERGRLQSNIEENAFFTVLKSFVNLGDRKSVV